MLIANSKTCKLCDKTTNEELYQARNCSHAFHSSCLTEQLQYEFNCPVCTDRAVSCTQNKAETTSMVELEALVESQAKDIKTFISQELKLLQAQLVESVYQKINSNDLQETKPNPNPEQVSMQDVEPVSEKKELWNPQETEPVLDMDHLSFEERSLLLDGLKQDYIKSYAKIHSQLSDLLVQFSLVAHSSDRSQLNSAVSHVMNEANALKNEMLVQKHLYANRFIKIARICSVPACLDK